MHKQFYGISLNFVIQEMYGIMTDNVIIIEETTFPEGMRDVLTPWVPVGGGHRNVYIFGMIFL